MKRLLLPILFVLLAVLTNRQGTEVPAIQEGQEISESLVFNSQDTHHHEATLTDASSLYRICSPRPQRIVPVHGSKTERTGNLLSLVHRHIVKPFHFLHDNRRRLETAPFCLSASCDYYVIALRRIIR